MGAPVPHGEGVTQSHDQRWEGRGLVGADRGGTCAAGRILRGAGQWPGTGPSKSSAAVWPSSCLPWACEEPTARLWLRARYCPFRVELPGS